MVTLRGEHIYLRALEPEDLDFILSIENNEDYWAISGTKTPYSRQLIKRYLDNAHKDLYEVKQLRLVISGHDDQPLGLIDLFDFDFDNRRAGLGIVIRSPSDRKKGYGSEALQLLIAYCFEHLYLHQLYCNVSEDNEASMALFKKQGFKKAGQKKDWNLVDGRYKDEYLFQYLNPHVH